MPIYEYTCADCGEQFEEIVLNDLQEITCPKCNSAQTNKLISSCRAKFAGDPLGQTIGAPASEGSCASCGGGSCSTCG